MTKISQLVRRDIIDELVLKNIKWHGRLGEVDFLSRLYDLSAIKSNDGRFSDAAGDIWQHRVNNYDWEDDWVFSDSRFGLNEDEIFLRFLCEMIHPVVRSDESEVSWVYEMLNKHLSRDGFEIVEKSKISERSIFVGRKKFTGKSVIHKSSKKILDVLSDDYVTKQIDLMNDAIDDSPWEAIGKAKELIEIICHTILEERKVEIDKDWDLLKLLKKTSQQLKLTPEGVDENVKASQVIKNVLGGLTTVVQGLGELRNKYGSGHGKKSKFKGLTPRHAKLAVGAASTLAVFLLETHKIRE